MKEIYSFNVELEKETKEVTDDVKAAEAEHDYYKRRITHLKLKK